MSATSGNARRTRRSIAGAGAACLTASLLPLTTGLAFAAPLNPTTVNSPPQAGREIVVFPSRDFVSASGFLADETVTVEVHHSGLYKNPDGSPIVVSTRNGLVPQDDPATPEFDGLVEVNHAGAEVWGPVTPDIRPGDKVRIIVDNKLDAAGQPVYVAEQTVTADMTTKRPVQTAPGTVVVKGVARQLVVDAQGQPVLDAAGAATYSRIPLDQVESRLISGGNLFVANGRRALRAPGDGGTIAFDDPADPTNFGWTATFAGLSPADVTRALEAEARGMWLGGTPAAGTELTIAEVGAGVTGGPQGPGNGPLEKLPPPPGSELEPPSVPAGAAATADVNHVTITWDAATDNVGVTSYGVYRNGVAIANVQNPDGSANPPLTYVDKNLPPGDYVYTVDAADEVGNRSAESQLTASVKTVERVAQTVEVNDPPSAGHEIVAFPSRDFVEVVGVQDGQLANVEIIRAGKVISTADGVIPTAGAVEVNHPGGACWDGVTPEVRANDVIRATIYDGATGDVVSRQQTKVANVSAAEAVQTAPDTVVIRGNAQGHDGTPLPLGELEARIISSSKEPFGKNGRRALLAPTDGTLAYDKVDNPLGTKFTATFSGLDAADVKLALEVESRIMWLGRDPLLGNELTIYEAGGGDPPGPATGFCSTPIEAPDSVAPSAPTVTATPDGPSKKVALSWSKSTDDHEVYGYRISRGDTPVANVGAEVTTFTDANVGPGEQTYTVQAYDAASALGAGADHVTRLQAGQGGDYGNLSAASNGVAVTMPDVTGPTAPGGFAVTNPTRTVTNPDGTTSEVATTNARLVWDASTDDVAVKGYRVFRKDAGAATFTKVAEGGVAATTATAADPFVKNPQGRIVWTNTRLTAGATYTYYVEAYDAVPNSSAKTPEVPVVIAADSVAPTSPANVKALTPDPRSKDVMVSWGAATDTINAAGDPGLVTAYRIYRNGTLLTSVNGTTLTFTDKGLAAETYTYKVEAVDSANNRSDRTAQEAGQAVVANDPPASGRAVLAFPARDFVEGDGYAPGERVRVQVLRNKGTADAADWQIAGTASVAADSAGLVEVNHAGPGCWTTTTPDIRGGDIVRIINSQGIADQTVVQDLTVQRPAQTAPGTIVVKGTAKSALGLPVDAGRLEHRLISTTTNYAKNGRNGLLAPSDGELVVSPDGSFTATYTGLAAADVTRALNAESIINWLGRDALLGNELTITENGPGTDGGPADGVCTAPLEPNVAQASLNPTTRSVFPDTVSGATSAARTVTLTNSGSAPMTVSAVYVAGANPGDFTVAPGTLPATLAPGASLAVPVTFKPTAVGARAATVNFVDNAANTSYQTVALTGNGVTAGAPATPGVPTRAMAFDTPLTNGATTAKVNLTWTTSAGAAKYEVQRSIASGAYTTVATVDAVPGATTATTAVDVTPGSAHRYQVRAVNDGGASAFATAAAFTLAPFQENNAAVTYRGTWPRTTLAGSFGGSVTSNAAAGNTATLRTNGTGFAVISSKGPDRGMVEVWVNGARRGTVNLYSPTVQPAHVIFANDGLANTTHSIEVRPTGARPAGSSGSRVDVDGFLAVR